MIPDRRTFALSPDQPILRRRRGARRPEESSHSEADFWKVFDVEKLCSFSSPGGRGRAGA